MTKSIFISLIAINILILSCGKPNNPDDYSGGYTIIKKMQTPGAANDLLIDNNTCFLSQGEAGLLIVNISNPTSPDIIKHFSEGVRGYSNKIAKKDNAIYLSANTFGITVIDVTDFDNPDVTFSNLQMKPAKNIHISGNFMIAAISENGFKIANIENPIHPDICHNTHTDGYTKDVTTNADNTKLFAATGEVGLSIFDISFFDDGYGIYPLESSLNLEGYAEDIELLDEQSIAFIASGKAGLQIVDYADTANPKVLASLETGGYAKELKYQNGKIYLAAENGGLQIIDVSNFSNPKLLGIVDTEKAIGVDVVGDYIFVADKIEGLIIISKKPLIE